MNRSLVIAFTLSLACVACSRRELKPDFSGDVTRLNGEVEALKEKLTVAEKAAAAKSDQIALATATATEAAKQQLAEKDKALTQKDAQLRVVQAELTALKKSDAVVFGEIRAVQARGLAATARDRYQQFLNDFPNSPLAPLAKNSFSETSSEVTRRDSQVDPQRREREVLQQFAENVVTLEEIAPILKNKSNADVVKLLGRPSQTLRNGAEITYAAKALNPDTGRKGMLIIRFDSGTVAALRVDYQGREIKP